MRGKIKSAFARRPYPGDENIVFQRIDCGGHESAETEDFFRGKDWRSLVLTPENHANGAAPGLNAYMTPEATAYFLPAFLLLALDLSGDADNPELEAMVDSLCFMLTRPSPTSLADQYEIVRDMPEVPDEIKEWLKNPSPEAKATEKALVERFDHLVAILTEAERTAVAGTLLLLADVYRERKVPDEFNDAQRALASTWAHFL